MSVTALRAQKSAAAKMRLACGLGKDDWDLVFHDALGNPRSPRAFSKEFGRVMKASEVRRITFHGLRHSHITDLLRQGVHVKVVSERAGHANIAVTLGIYGHVMPSMQADVATLLDRQLGTVLENIG